MSDTERKRSKSRKSYKSSLFVRNLGQKVTIEDLKKLFSKYAEVKDVYLPRDYRTGDPRGFGFVEFFNREDAMDAMDKTNGVELNGAAISVMIAKEGRKTPSEMKGKDRRRNRSGSRGRRRRHRRSSSSRSSRSESRGRKRDSRKRKHKRSSSRSSSGSRSRSRSSGKDGVKKTHSKRKFGSRSKERGSPETKSNAKDDRSKSGSRSGSRSRSKSSESKK